MAEGEFGKFDFSGVHIDINKNMTEYDVIATSLHELTHQILASSSTVGIYSYQQGSGENIKKINRRVEPERYYSGISIHEEK